MVVIYHWQELPQVSFLSRQKFCRNKHMFVATKNTSFVTTKACLLRKTFVTTNMCLFCCDKNILSYFCKTVVVTKIILVAAPANGSY